MMLVLGVIRAKWMRDSDGFGFEICEDGNVWWTFESGWRSELLSWVCIRSGASDQSCIVSSGPYYLDLGVLYKGETLSCYVSCIYS